MNNVQIAGRLSNIFDSQEYGKGKDKMKVLGFKVAVARSADAADFIPVKAFNNVATVIEEHFNVGDQIIIDGSIRTGSYDDEDGETHYTVDIVANRVEFGAKKLEKKGSKK